jgi:hypothetical protein
VRDLDVKVVGGMTLVSKQFDEAFGRLAMAKVCFVDFMWLFQVLVFALLCACYSK